MTVPDRGGSAPDINEQIPPFDADMPEVRIASGSALSLLAKVVGLGTSFLIGILVARVLGVEGKGTLSIVMQVPGLLILALDLGVGTSTIYFITSGKLRPGNAAANAAVLAVILSILGGPIVYLLLAGPASLVPGIPLWTALLAISILPTGLFAGWMSSVSLGVGNLALTVTSSIASSVTTILGIAVLAATHATSIGAVVGMSVLGTIAGIVVFVLGLRGRLTPFSPDLQSARNMAGFSAKVYMGGIAGYLHERQDILLLGWLAGTAAVGLYSVSVSFAELAWYVPTALSTAILAKGSRRGDVSAIDYTTRTSRVAIIFMLITIGLSLAVVPLAIPLVYGKAFAPAAFAFFALLPGVLADGVSRILWSYQITRGKMYWKLAVASAVVNVAAVLLLVPRLGAVGAALASTVSYTVLAALVIRHFCIDTGASLAQILLPSRSDFRVISRSLVNVMTRRRDDERAKPGDGEE